MSERETQALVQDLPEPLRETGRDWISDFEDRHGSGSLTGDLLRVAVVSEVASATLIRHWEQYDGDWTDPLLPPTRDQVTAHLDALGASDASPDIVKRELRQYRARFLTAMIGKLVRNLYVYAGEDRVRSFAEWRLLKKLADFGLPVPRPAAAYYRRRGLFYTADLITVRLPLVEPLSAAIRERRDADFWRAIGSGIQRFHDHGVYHADMPSAAASTTTRNRWATNSACAV